MFIITVNLASIALPVCINLGDILKKREFFTLKALTYSNFFVLKVYMRAASWKKPSREAKLGAKKKLLPRTYALLHGTIIRPTINYQLIIKCMKKKQYFRRSYFANFYNKYEPLITPSESRSPTWKLKYRRMMAYTISIEFLNI